MKNRRFVELTLKILEEVTDKLEAAIGRGEPTQEELDLIDKARNLLEYMRIELEHECDI